MTHLKIMDRHIPAWMSYLQEPQGKNKTAPVQAMKMHRGAE